ncbi:MEAB protein [Drechmeria coniospora]|uniref:MEAB protein n=1 Tax=Drechmeria coniospora TaxID=98403 RepID=A0A151GSU8_DRECN|nr:MEAB protein [Drechmeria coniospora]KYK60196.1 MEAB protein [Drechmeria coniospora]ODA80139.1 hypothetical protein RJ55_03097 [Drechmeria coniospora]
MADEMSIDTKPNPSHESDHSVNSTPERDQNSASASGNNAPHSQDPQQPKRKGGRKPIYATSEERKQRNRQAQAAFRERRTEYIKQLEETIRVHESNLQNLQVAHRNAAEECLMFRYKNSLLERILLEKGIDVHAELQAKTGSPDLRPNHALHNLVQPPPIQRSLMNRQHQPRRSISSIAPKVEPGTTPLNTALLPHKPVTSPTLRPTHSSHSSSPTTNIGPAFSPAPSDSISMRGSAGGLSRQGMPTPNANSAPRPRLLRTGRGQSSANGANYYPTPAFQAHIENMDHEYGCHTDMVDDSEINHPHGPASFNGGFNGHNQQTMLLSPTSTAPGQSISQPHTPNTSVPPQQFPSMTQLLDQNFEYDPFGLGASMAFPNHQHFHFDHANVR